MEVAQVAADRAHEQVALVEAPVAPVVPAVAVAKAVDMVIVPADLVVELAAAPGQELWPLEASPDRVWMLVSPSSSANFSNVRPPPCLLSRPTGIPLNS